MGASRTRPHPFPPLPAVPRLSATICGMGGALPVLARRGGGEAVRPAFFVCCEWGGGVTACSAAPPPCAGPLLPRTVPQHSRGGAGALAPLLRRSRWGQGSPHLVGKGNCMQLMQLMRGGGGDPPLGPDYRVCRGHGRGSTQSSEEGHTSREGVG
eukprot:gene13608-biopygen8041